MKSQNIITMFQQELDLISDVPRDTYPTPNMSMVNRYVPNSHTNLYVPQLQQLLSSMAMTPSLYMISSNPWPQVSQYQQVNPVSIAPNIPIIPQFFQYSPNMGMPWMLQMLQVPNMDMMNINYTTQSKRQNEETQEQDFQEGQ